MAEGDHDKLGMRAELDQLNNAEPFVPFEVVVTSGDRFVIESPGTLVVTKDLLLVYPRDGRQIVIRVTELVFVQHVPGRGAYGTDNS